MFAAAVLALLASVPSLDGVPHVSTRFGFGHICPVSAEYALTAAHVIDPAPLDSDVPLLSLAWSDNLGNRGEATPVGTSRYGDLGWVRSRFPITFPIATELPAVGTPVFMSSFGWRFEDKVTKAKVLRYIGNMMVFDKNPEGGSSGGCVLNEAGQVVGIVAWGNTPENVGMAVNVLGLGTKPEEKE